MSRSVNRAKALLRNSTMPLRRTSASACLRLVFFLPPGLHSGRAVRLLQSSGMLKRQRSDEAGNFYFSPRKVMDELTVLASELDFGAGAVPPARGDVILDEDSEEYRYANEEAEFLRDTDEWRIPVVQVDD